MRERYEVRRYIEGYEAALADARRGPGFTAHVIQVAGPAALEGRVNAHWFQGYKDAALGRRADQPYERAVGMN